jgi:hypothetical protein
MTGFVDPEHDFAVANAAARAREQIGVLQSPTHGLVRFKAWQTHRSILEVPFPVNEHLWHPLGDVAVTAEATSNSFFASLRHSHILGVGEWVTKLQASLVDREVTSMTAERSIELEESVVTLAQRTFELNRRQYDLAPLIVVRSLAQVRRAALKASKND